MAAPARVAFRPSEARVRAAARARFTAAAREFRLFPEVMSAAHRDAISLLYVFARELDDAVDGASDPAAALRLLDAAAAELEGTRPRRAVLAALVPALDAAGATAHVLDFVAGTRRDVQGSPVETDDDLVRHAYDVSATIGLAIYRLLGIERPGADWRAVDLGIALQLTDVARDVRADAARGRVYVPSDRLARAGLVPEDLLRRRAHPAAVNVVAAGVADRAEPYYASAAEAVPDLPLLYRHGVLLMSRLYRRVGRRVREAGPPEAAGLALSAREVARGLGETLGLALAPRRLGLGAPRPHDPALHRAIAGRPGTNPAAGGAG